MSISSSLLESCHYCYTCSEKQVAQNFSLTNFRPISVLSKILERVISDQIVDHFQKHNLFSYKQSGFCHGYST